MKTLDNLHVLSHPLIKAKVDQLRTMPAMSEGFSRNMASLGVILGYEASHDMVFTHCHSMDAHHACGCSNEHQVLLVPIMRTGLGMLEPMLTLFCCAKIGGLGFYANPRTSTPTLYHSDVQDGLEDMEIFILDSVVATGKTVLAAVDYVKQHGGRKIRCLHILGAPEGIELLCTTHPDVQVYLAQMDQGLDENGHLIPGMKAACHQAFCTL